MDAVVNVITHLEVIKPNRAKIIADKNEKEFL